MALQENKRRAKSEHNKRKHEAILKQEDENQRDDCSGMARTGPLQWGPEFNKHPKSKGANDNGK